MHNWKQGTVTVLAHHPDNISSTNIDIIIYAMLV